MKVVEIVCCCKVMNDHEKECKDCPCTVECDDLLKRLRECKPCQLSDIIYDEY